MSPLTAKPVLHGRDHCPGGADPIPCLNTGGGVIYADYVRTFTSLSGYWRLGETASPWADTSGATGGPRNLSLQAHGVAMTPDVTPGGLPVGQDDGAVKFNYAGTAFNGGDWLTSSVTSFFVLGSMTASAFVNVHAYPAGTDRGNVAGSIGWSVAIPNQYVGWAFQTLPSGKIRFTRGGQPSVSEVFVDSPGALVLDTWYHVAASYDFTTGALKLYLNGTLVATTAAAAGLSSGSSNGIIVGTLDISSSRHYFTGSVDEFAVWNAPLSDGEIATLASAVATSTVGDGDQVLISDGAGGSHFGQANGNAIADGSIMNRHVNAAADIVPTKLQHPGGTTTFLRGDGTWATPAGGAGASPTDTAAWMPLTTTVGTDDVLVFDASHQLIPTFTPI